MSRDLTATRSCERCGRATAGRRWCSHACEIDAALSAATIETFEARSRLAETAAAVHHGDTETRSTAGTGDGA
jgi:hypothetical protein